MLPQVTDLTNLRSAFARVEASKGMAGVDGVTIREFGRDLEINLRGLACELEEGRYRPFPLLRFQVAKPDGSPRTLTVPCVRDRVAQAAVLNVIGPVFEAEFEDVSFAYRKGRSVRQAVYRIRDLRDQGYCYVIEADIDSYFENIDIDLLMEKVKRLVPDPEVLHLIRTWVRAEIYDGERVYVNAKSIPQGTVVSPALANLFLDEFDETMTARGCQVVRYSDDFIVLARSSEQAKKALLLTEEILWRLGLDLDAEDTHITEFRQGFKFLGLTFFNDFIMAPYDRPPKEKKVLYMPPPFDMKGYLAGKRQWS